MIERRGGGSHAVLVALAACGRLRFDPVATGDASGDAAPDPRLIAWYTFEGGLANRITADVTGHGCDAACATGFACPTVSQGHLGLAIANCAPALPTGILRFTIGDASNFARQAVTTPLLFDQWLHIAATYDGSTMHLYVDGVELAAPIAGGAMGYDAQPLVLGSDRNSGVSAENFNRAIDDVRIYGVVLSASEIAALASM
jgi:hypothetical protein